jgi:hypothetical protein
VVYYVIALALFRRLNLAAVLRQLAAGIRWLWPDKRLRLPTAAALVYRRRQLDTPVMRHVFQHVCRPMATAQTKGAFRFGLRLMAGDSTLDEVPDTPANASYFGRLSSGKNQSPFPQVRCFYLAEVGTHAIVDAVAGSLSGERASRSRRRRQPLGAAGDARAAGSRRRLSGPGSSTLVHQRHAHGLARLKADQFTQVEQVLSDGSSSSHPASIQRASRASARH